MDCYWILKIAGIFYLYLLTCYVNKQCQKVLFLFAIICCLMISMSNMGFLNYTSNLYMPFTTWIRTFLVRQLIISRGIEFVFFFLFNLHWMIVHNRHRVQNHVIYSCIITALIWTRINLLEQSSRLLWIFF